MTTKRTKTTKKTAKKAPAKKAPKTPAPRKRGKSKIAVYDATLAEQPVAETTPKRTRKAAAPTPEAQIRRMFKGKELVINVVDGKFVFEGETFSSLSALAKSIVGYGISGPHFFKLDAASQAEDSK